MTPTDPPPTLDPPPDPSPDDSAGAAPRRSPPRAGSRAAPLAFARTLLPPSEPGSGEPAWRSAFVVVSAAVLLVIPEYATTHGGADAIARTLSWIGLDGPASIARDAYRSARIDQLAWWSAWTVACWGVAPVLLWKLVLRRSLADLGLGFGLTRKHLPIYAMMAAVMLPIVALMSGTRAFQEKYPFLRVDPGAIDWALLARWELMYALQFVALELFFRGYLTLGLRRRLGGDAVWVMVIPYCMIHFGKPMPETLAAIVAGVALGSLALRTRSIWMGAALHIAVAWSMDAASLIRQAG